MLYYYKRKFAIQKQFRLKPSHLSRNQVLTISVRYQPQINFTLVLIFLEEMNKLFKDITKQPGCCRSSQSELQYTINGKNISFSDFKDKVTVLITWSTNLAVGELTIPFCVEVITNWAGCTVCTSFWTIMSPGTSIACAIRRSGKESSQKAVVA